MTALVDGLIPPDEDARIEVVRRYEILDTPPDGAFDRITALAARLFGVPIAIVSVVDTDRIWFKSHHGLPGVSEIGREAGLCASAILDTGPRIVNDAVSDPRTLANPLVAGSFGLRFYAAVPLTTHDGYNLGTLCVIDHEPREVTAAELQTLQDLAALVMDELELRLAGRRTIAREERLRREAEELAEALQASLLPPLSPELPGMEIATRYLAGEQGLKVGGDFFDVFRLASNDWGIVLGDACGKEPDRPRWRRWCAGPSGRRRCVGSSRARSSARSTRRCWPTTRPVSTGISVRRCSRGWSSTPAGRG